MSNDGGSFYPIHGVGTEIAPGASLRERFAVAIVAGAILHSEPGDMPSSWVLDQAQALTDEAMKRRDEDAKAAKLAYERKAEEAAF